MLILPLEKVEGTDPVMLKETFTSIFDVGYARSIPRMVFLTGVFP
jgi:hypothetical protein